MGKTRNLETISDFQRALRQGYGLGSGKDYKPWLRIQDVKSKGKRSAIHGLKTDRTHHLLSSGEAELFYLVEFANSVVDIREQFPIFPLTYTQKVAELIGVEHPKHPVSKDPIIITTDVLLTKRSGNTQNTSFHAISVKLDSFLKDSRAVEKQDLERVCWELLGVPFSLYVSNEKSMTKSANITWATAPLRDGSCHFDSDQIITALNLISVGRFYLADLHEKFENNQVADNCDDLVRFLIARRYISVDLDYRIPEQGIVDIQNVVRLNGKVAINEAS
ncbi:TnsA endonuclease N-terminal domain-containing protein [Alkalimonas collagenimarina]|uniref:TnsA endonuclease N-terminal domain-containing protein n=1 Tax=Alkalimonas collagenimarina TaxID=400390 RepID=A0ABT9H3Q7_9GAMM|nr:TnsA endonuclease N-terminal domain-containing protein [Alkalimonas collagenimarina]MDP4537966.1 TnsA endonuclease N-terminal domain-containing protein [Alkalimonas collagenimarina]